MNIRSDVTVLFSQRQSTAKTDDCNTLEGLRDRWTPPSDDEENTGYWPSKGSHDKVDGDNSFSQGLLETLSHTSTFTPKSRADVLYHDAPPFAFPTTYPPPCPPDPFPCRYGDTSFCKAKLGPRVITRAGCPSAETECDVLSLTAAFEKLTMKGESCISGSESSRGYDVTSSYTTRPLRAPLDSMVRRRKQYSILYPSTRISLQSHLLETPPNSEEASMPISAQDLLDTVQQIKNATSASREFELDCAASFYSLSTESEDSLPSLSCSSSSSIASDDGSWQGSPVLSLLEQDFLSPSFLCDDLPSILPSVSSPPDSLPLDTPRARAN